VSKIDFITDYPAILILIIAVVVVLISKFLQKKFIDKEKIKSLQSKVKEKSKLYQDAIKSNDKNKIEKSQEEMFAIQSELMQQMMPGQMKLMLITLPIFMVVFYVLGSFYEGISFNYFFSLPTFEAFNFINPFTWIPNGFSISTGYKKAYIFSGLFASIILTIVEKMIEKKKKI
jgi:uncharacterized membrane protein (DUF106 family)